MSFKPVLASIITIGDELLIGQTIDTNSAFIAQELNKIGVWVHRRVAVGDEYNEIWHTLEEEENLSEIIIITGGLGPTSDDITKPLLCKYFGGQLVVHEEVRTHVQYLLEKIYQRPGLILERNLKQAEVPDVCTVLHNARGTAPGMLFQKNRRLFFALPGVPHEMKGLMRNEVIPRLLTNFKLPAIVHKTVFTAGRGESMIAELLSDFESALPGHIKLAYLPNYGTVKLRLTSMGEHQKEVEKQMAPYFQKLQALVKDFLVTSEDEALETVIGKILKANGKTMGTAESCTGGFIAHLITSVAGSSAYYKGSIISYANEVKESILGVNRTILASAGAVSEEAVIQMLHGALSVLQVDYVLATSGIMGPDGGTEEKPVGTVWIAAGGRDETGTIRIETQKLNLRFDRQRNISTTATFALNFFRKFILSGN